MRHFSISYSGVYKDTGKKCEGFVMLCASDEINAQRALAERHLKTLLEEIDNLEIRTPELIYEMVV